MAVKRRMSGDRWLDWLDYMVENDLAEDERHIARLLGVSRQCIEKRKRIGTDQETALACLALIHGAGWNLSDWVE